MAGAAGMIGRFCPVSCAALELSGDWLSRLERAVHIREVTGSNPVSPTKVTSHESGASAPLSCTHRPERMPESGLVEFPLSSVSCMELLQQQDTDRRESVGRVMPSPRR
jgi:hypothetical protein